MSIAKSLYIRVYSDVTKDGRPRTIWWPRHDWERLSKGQRERVKRNLANGGPATYELEFRPEKSSTEFQ